MLYNRTFNDSNILKNSRDTLKTIAVDTGLTEEKLVLRAGSIHYKGNLYFNHGYQGRAYKTIESCKKVYVVSPYSDFHLLPKSCEVLDLESVIIRKFTQFGTCGILNLNEVIGKASIGVRYVSKINLVGGSYSPAFRIGTDSVVDLVSVNGSIFVGNQPFVDTSFFSIKDSECLSRLPKDISELKLRGKRSIKGIEECGIRDVKSLTIGDIAKTELLNIKSVPFRIGTLSVDLQKDERGEVYDHLLRLTEIETLEY